MKTTSNKFTKYDTGKIGIYYLVKIWNYYSELKNNVKNPEKVEWKYVNGVFNCLGVGIEPTIKYLMQYNNSFIEFEDWLLKNGRVSNLMVKHFNDLIDAENETETTQEENIFNQEELKEWDKQGYIILKNAIPKTDCQQTVDFIYDQIEASKSDPSTWYHQHPLKQGIMIQLFNSKLLDKNRFSKKIKLAYHQLWKRNDLMLSMDRVSFNPPENDEYHFPGPNLHWDMSLKKPIYFGLQGLLYLTDTKEDQGAFTLIPGFHNIIDGWLDSLKPDQNPRELILTKDFTSKPIAGDAGDFIIWNQSLPHGSSPNTSNSPRVVQYINYQPLNLPFQTEWI